MSSVTSSLRLTVFATVVGLFAATAIACGPVQSTSQISRAEGYLERARVNDAEVHSPYEYQRAKLYLYKAKEEWGHSNFEKSRDYARQARRAARAAIDNTREAPWRGHPIHGFDLPQEIEELEQEMEHADDLGSLDED